MRPKKQKPPICIGGSEKLRAINRPRYMNVPSTARCHVNVAGVGKQPVWGWRIIASISVFNFTFSISHDFRNSSIPKSDYYCRCLHPVRLGILVLAQTSRTALKINYGEQAGSPTRIPSLGPKRHHALDHASLPTVEGMQRIEL